ncbi:MAG: anti-sigma factor antagonist [Bacilli bacterium]|nr:anti-sigma factor antagonist [Bacilli bacterium]
MRFELKEKTLVLYFDGELNSYNADGIEKEIEDIISKNKFENLILDFSRLNYISSAGLRTILKLKQRYNSTKIVEASLEVYDVLSMTGFVNIMSVEKALKRVDVTGAEIVGEGFFSTVYRVDKDTIIKVFNRTSDTNQIQRELHLSKQAFVLGIPTAISFDIVRVGDKLGVRFEMLDCDSLKNTYINNPNRYDELTDKYVNLLKTINTTESMDNELPDSKNAWLEKLNLIKPYFEADQFNKLEKLIEGIKDRNTFVHGDCHFKNIMVQKDELILIDMDTLSHGHPIFELAAIYCPYVAFEEDDPGNVEKFLGVKYDFSTKLFNDIVTRYIGKNDEETFDKIRIVAYSHMMWWTLVNQKDNSKRFNGCKERLLKLLDKNYKNLDIGL